MSHLPEGFSYLEDIDASIVQQIVGATSENLLGHPWAGYEAHRCIVSTALGKNLAKVQKDAKAQGLSLLVYDAYRPLRAVEDFVFWSQDTTDTKTKADYYPYTDKKDFFALGYIGMRSFHCRGAAVDLTLVPLDTPNQPLDMGTSLDFMDETSHTANPGISPEAKKNRQLLCDLMHAHGFENYEKEWWHFNLKDEPFPDQYFDFPIK